MNELIEIKRHSFELAKNRLKRFSQKTDPEMSIEKVATEGYWIPFTEHKVKGAELNSRLEAIQQIFIEVNKRNNKVIKEFREVYAALDILDKDYITGIVANVKALEKTSNDVRSQQQILKQHNNELKDHNNRLEKQQIKLNDNQKKIDKTVTNISKIVNVLKDFKEKIDKYKHLDNIDKIWYDYKKIEESLESLSKSTNDISEKLKKELAAVKQENASSLNTVKREISNILNQTESFNENISNLSKKIDDSVLMMNEQIENIQETTIFVESLKSTAHIQNVDSMWADIEKCKIDADVMNNSISEHQIKLGKLFLIGEDYKKDISTLFSKLAEIENDVKKNNYLINKLSAQGENSETRVAQLEEKMELTVDHLSELVQADTNIAENIHVAVDSLNKKIKNAYWIAGGALCCAIVELFFLITKVM